MHVGDTRVDHPIGREREIGSIVGEITQRGTCYVSGPAGIGKSMVLREVRRQLVDQGVDVISISGMEATALVPLAPLLRLCPPGADDAGAAIIAELYRRSRSSDVAVIVDDAHLLDDATAAIVRQLASADILGLVVAQRDGETVPEAISSIIDEGLGRHVELSPLDHRSIAQLAEHMLGATEQKTVDWIWEHSQGNPLYTRELIFAGVQTGALQEEEGRWVAVDAPIWTSRLHALVARRLAGLTPEERSCLQLVAVAGRLPLEILAESSNLETVFELEKRNLLLVDGHIAEMGHPLYGTAVLATMSDARARATSLRIAAALEASEVHNDPVVATSLRLDAGEEPDSNTLRAALSAARVSRLPERAERFSRLLLNRREDPEVRMCLCEALGVQKRWEEAEEELETILGASPPEDHPGILERWAFLNFEFRADLSETRAVIEDLTPRIGEAGTDSWQLLLLRIGLFTGNLDESVRRNREWLSQNDGSPLRPLVVVNLASGCSHSGDFALGLESAHNIGTLADPVERARLDSVVLHSRAWLEGFGAVAGLMEENLQQGVASGDPEREVLARIYQGIVLNDFMRPMEALSHLRTMAAMERYARRRRVTSLLFGEMARATAGTESGQAEAREWLQRLFQFPREMLWPSAPLGKLAEAMLAYRTGEDPLSPIQEGLEYARSRAARIHEVPLLRLLAQLERAGEVADRLDEIVRHMGGGLAALVSREAQALAERDPAQLDDVAMDAWSFGALGLASDASAWAVGLHTDRGNPRGALVAELRSDAIVAGQPVWSVARDRMARVLSDREQQVVEAVAAGASNREVAETMFISHRTVESHLRRIYGRFGLEGREDLNALVAVAVSGPRPPEHSRT